MQMKIKLGRAVDGKKTITIEENKGQMSYKEYGIVIVDSAAGEETLVPWANVDLVRITGITEEDVEEVIRAAQQKQAQLQPDLQVERAEPRKSPRKRPARKSSRKRR